MAKKTTVLEFKGKTMDEVAELLEAATKEQLRLVHATINGEHCTYSYTVRLLNGESDTITNDCGRAYHNDLKSAFKSFNSHLALITEQVEPSEIQRVEDGIGTTDEVTEKLLQFDVTAVKIEGNLEAGSIMLSGIKVLKTNDEIKLKTPKVSLDSDYEFINELVAAVQNLIVEVTAYHNCKSRPEPQMEMFAEEDEVENQ